MMSKKGSMRNKSSIQLQTREQAHVNKEFHEIKENDGIYISKPDKNTCMSFNHKSLHECF
jgi:DNA-binding cell septation regulator SpoVG